MLPVLLALLAGVAGGCVQTSTPAIRAAARHLSDDVDAYRQQQQARLDRLNAEYRAGFDRLMDAAEVLYRAQAHQQFEQTTQSRADGLVTDWPKATLPNNLRAAFSEDITAQRKAINDAEAAIEAARNNYADAWRDVSLDLAQLKSVKAKLDTLAQPEDQARVTADFVVTVAQVYQKLRDADQQKKSGNSSATQSGAGGNPSP
jgi:DNA repair exonuclease SbcCD ATPase subunit